MKPVPKKTDAANTLGALALAIVDRMQSEISDASGLHPNDAAAVNAIGFRPDCSVRTLAQLLALTHPGAVRCANRLTSAGLVERREGTDGRTVALRLTPAGRSVWNSLRRRRMTWLNGLIETLPLQEQDIFRAAVGGLLQKIAPDPNLAERTCRLCDESICVPSRCPIT